MAQTFTPSGIGLKPLPPPDEPTDAMPGTERKIVVMHRRIASGRHPHHPLDARDSDMSRGYAAEAPEANTRKPHGNAGKKREPRQTRPTATGPCMTPSCVNGAVSCGVCNRCYLRLRQRVLSRKTTRQEQEQAGQILPAKVQEEAPMIDESIGCKRCHRRIARTRGQCVSCYATSGKAVRAGETTWAALEAEGKASTKKPKNPHWGPGEDFSDRREKN